MNGMQRWQAAWPVAVVLVLTFCGCGSSAAPDAARMDAARLEVGQDTAGTIDVADVAPSDAGVEKVDPAFDARAGRDGGAATDLPASACLLSAQTMPGANPAPPGGLPGVPSPPMPSLTGDPGKLPPQEIVGRLARFLWRVEPDAALLARVQGCMRLTVNDVIVLADMMLQDARAARGLQAFVAWWLQLDRLATEQRDPASFPPLTDELRRSMAEEVRLFAAHVMFNDSATLPRLLTAPYSFVDRQLAPIYGVPAVDDSFRRIDFGPADERAGLLTMPGVLAVSGGFDRHSGPVRGKRLLERVLCTEVPPPPPMVTPQIPPPAERPGQSLRQAMERTMESPVCLGCHSMLEVGFALEPFDAIGRHRTSDNGVPIDARAQVRDPMSANAFAVSGPVDLMKQLADQESTHRCFASRWLEFAVGRPAVDQSPFVVEALTRMFRSANLDLRALIAQVTITPPFLAP
jgi:hypothetical protein